MNLKIIIRLTGILLLVEGIAMLISLLIAVLSGGRDAAALAISSASCLVPGFICFFLGRRYKKDVSRRDGFFIVSMGWILLSFFGCLPFMISGYIPRLTDAFFETMSGFTTTGASILDAVESLPKGLLFWRAMTQWLGGMGIIVLALSFLPAFGIGSAQLYDAEAPGVMLDKISPHLYQTARIIWLVYIFFTLLETCLLRIGGMTWFDSICHSFTTMATGGFSTKQASIAYWSSPFIHYVIILFMSIAATNFTLLFFALKGRPGKLFRDEEYRYYLLFILGFTVLIFSGLLITTDTGAEQLFRESLFTVVSIITTTGYVLTDYLQWAPVLVLLTFAIFFFGGSTGSTGGGIKIMRIVILLKNSYYELRRLIHPNAVIPVRFNRRSVETRYVNNILAFFMFYFFIFFFSSIIFTLFEPDMATSMGAVATCLGNIGPGLGSVGPVCTFSHIHDAGKWFLSFLMMLGRLELFTVLVIFTPTFWKK
jgi:trk system potassium uptake protein TrkH